MLRTLARVEPLAPVWRETTLAPQRAGATTTAHLVLENGGAATWRSRGAEGLQLSYHWLDAQGRSVLREGARSLFATPVEPGKGAGATMKIQTPAEPGDYLLELDLVREQVSWFSDRNPASTRRVPVKIVAAAAPAR